MKRSITYILLFIALLLPLQAMAREYTVANVPNVQVADRTRFVSDPDNYLDDASRRRIDSMLMQLRDSNTVEVAVVVLSSIGDSDIDLFATDLFTRWGVGQKENSNGLLMLAVMDQRNIVLRTGYGIEGVLPDAICKRIITHCIVPAFREERYGEGLESAVSQIVQLVTTPEASAELMAQIASEQDAKAAKTRNLLLSLLGIYLLFCLVPSLIITILLRNQVKSSKGNPTEGYHRLTSMHGMVQLFALFTPLWGVANLMYLEKKRNAFRNQPRPCPACGSTMYKLSEDADNAFLTPQEDMEEQVGSVDYDVWRCDACGNVDIYRFDIAHSKYSECPQCHCKAYSFQRDHIVTPATTITAGRGEHIYTCRYCKCRNVVPFIIPMIVVPTVSNRGGGFGGGGSIGGGFGGGMTGGGGARGGW